jgi:ApaG protein
VTNVGPKEAQLISRKWFIEDATGKVEVVEGPGVVGKQPLFTPQSTFTYVSYCPLHTLTGRMWGHFYMKDFAGDFFILDTPEFTFEIPSEYTEL